MGCIREHVAGSPGRGTSSFARSIETPTGGLRPQEGYPVVVGRLPSEQHVLIHDRDSYPHLEIDAVKPKRWLSMRELQRNGFFHSRLQISTEGLFKPDLLWAAELGGNQQTRHPCLPLGKWGPGRGSARD